MPFNSNRVRKLGDILSAILFYIVIAAIVLRDSCNSGFSIGVRLLSNLSYANDITAISNSQNDLQKFLDALVIMFF